MSTYHDIHMHTHWMCMYSIDPSAIVVDYIIISIIGYFHCRGLYIHTHYQMIYITFLWEENA